MGRFSGNSVSERQKFYNKVHAIQISSPYNFPLSNNQSSNRVVPHPLRCSTSRKAFTAVGEMCSAPSSEGVTFLSIDAVITCFVLFSFNFVKNSLFDRP